MLKSNFITIIFIALLSGTAFAKFIIAPKAQVLAIENDTQQILYIDTDNDQQLDAGELQLMRRIPHHRAYTPWAYMGPSIHDAWHPATEKDLKKLDKNEDGILTSADHGFHRNFGLRPMGEKRIMTGKPIKAILLDSNFVIMQNGDVNALRKAGEKEGI